MIRSMTGYGVAIDSFNDATISVELKSVNHKYLDISFRAPKFLSLWEKDFRDTIREKVLRGKIYLSINFENQGKLFSGVEVDIELARHYYNALKKLGSALEITDNLTIKDFLGMRGVFELKEIELDENFRAFLMSILNRAIDNMIKMKKDEGEHLEKDIKKRIDILNQHIDKIDKSKDAIVDNYKTKLKKNIEKVFGDKKELVDEKRLEFEITIFSDKVDITEEIIRFRSHIAKFLSTIEEAPPIGKKLDFILQEMNREINTIGSKNNLNNLTNIVIEAKTQIEKIREQVQNIE